MKKGVMEIDPDLYAEVREYCDTGGLRFVRFIEEALEDAMDREAARRRLDAAEKSHAEVEALQRKAYRRGYRDGFSHSLLACAGHLWGLDRAREELQGEDPPKMVTGPQLDLFG